jgi:outer membrane receptor protein involved in Fe transport
MAKGVTTRPARRVTGLAILALAAGRPLLAQDAVPRLDTVRVTSRASTLAAPTRSVEVIGRDELDRRSARSIGEILAYALGTDVAPRSAAQADLSLRGSTFNQVLVLVDGIRVSDVQSGHYNLDLTVPVAAIDRIEILRGAASALYGSDAIGGVVNIVTRPVSGPPAGQVHGGSFGDAGAAVSAGTTIAHADASASAQVDRSDGHRAGTGYRIVQVRAAAGRPTPVGRLVADVGEGVRDFGASDFYSPYPSWETTRSSTASLRLEPDDARRFAVSAAVHVRRHHDLFTLIRDDPARYQNEHLSWQTGLESAARIRVTPLVSAAVGGDVLDATLRSARLGDHDERRTGAFGELTIGRPATGTLDVGARADRITGIATQGSPFVGVAIPLSPRLQLRASAGRGFRAPTWTERFYTDPANIADSTLQVEHFWTDEIGVRAAPLGELTIDMAYFERHASSLIDWARPDGSAATTPWRTQNFASAVFRGVEGTVQAPELVGIRWLARASALRFESSAATGTVGKYALRPITSSMGLEASAAPVEGANLVANVLHARRAGEPGHLQLDMRWSQSLRSAWLSAELLNLTGADYLDAAGKPVAGRSLLVAIGWPPR